MVFSCSYVQFSTQDIIQTATATTLSFSPSVLRLLKKISYMLSSTDIATANYNLVNQNNIKQIFQR